MGREVPSERQAEVMRVLNQPFPFLTVPEKRVAGRMAKLGWVFRYVPDGSPQYRLTDEGRAALKRYREQNNRKEPRR